MKKLLLIAALMLVSIGVSAQGEQFAIGGNAGVGVYKNSYSPFGFGPKFQFYFADHWRGEASFTYWSKKDNFGGFMDFNGNVHYVFNVADKVNLYPIGGITVVSTHSLPAGQDNQTLIGFNLGGGAEFYIASHLKLNLDIKYQYAQKEKTYNGFIYRYEAEGPVFQAGVAYCF